MWATDTNATLDHTAGAQWGSNTGASTVDAEKEHYNNDAASAWAGCAYVKFSFELPAGESITKAILTYSVNQGGRSGRNDIIYYMAKDFDLDWATFAGQKGTDLRNTANRADLAVASAPTGGTGDRLNLTQEVTGAVRAIYEAGQNYIIFQLTGNAGGADLYGKASANAPTLVITTTSASTYNVTFSETNGVSATIKMGSTDVTSGTALIDGTYDFTATAEGYKDYEGSFTVAGADKEVSFTMTAKAVYNYTVKGVDGSENDLGTVSSGSAYEGDVTYYYPEFVLDGTTLYYKASNGGNPYWGATGTLDADNKVFTVTYGGEAIENVVFYKEAEEMDGFTPKTTNNATIRCSQGTGGIVSGEVKLTTLEAGKYKIFGQVWGTTGLTVGVKAYGVDVWTQASTGSLTSSTSEEFSIYGTTDLYVYTTGGTDNRMLDLIYIVKTGEAPTSAPVAIIDASGWATYVAPAALDFSGVEGLTAYTATCDGSKVTLTPVEDVQAGTAVVLKGAAKSYDVPVIASSETAKGDLKASVTAIAYNAEATSDYYYLALNGESKAQFTKLTSGSIAAGKAYLEIAKGEGARNLAIVIAGETTGIKAIETAKAANGIFNINGQRIAAPQKGLYIVNGKKVVIK